MRPTYETVTIFDRAVAQYVDGALGVCFFRRNVVRSLINGGVVGSVVHNVIIGYECAVPVIVARVVVDAVHAFGAADVGAVQPAHGFHGHGVAFAVYPVGAAIGFFRADVELVVGVIPIAVRHFGKGGFVDVAADIRKRQMFPRVVLETVGYLVGRHESDKVVVGFAIAVDAQCAYRIFAGVWFAAACILQSSECQVTVESNVLTICVVKFTRTNPEVATACRQGEVGELPFVSVAHLAEAVALAPSGAACWLVVDLPSAVAGGLEGACFRCFRFYAVRAVVAQGHDAPRVVGAFVEACQFVGGAGAFYAVPCAAAIDAVFHEVRGDTRYRVPREIDRFTGRIFCRQTGGFAQRRTYTLGDEARATARVEVETNRLLSAAVARE